MCHPESRGHLYNVIMATVNPRRVLVYKIQKRLCDLSASQLLQVASSIDDDSMTDRVDELSEPELYDLIVDYIKSEKLGALEDGGMAQLLHLDDILSDLVAMEGEAVGVVQTVPPEQPFNRGAPCPATPTTDIPRHSLHMDRDARTNPSTESRDLHTYPSPAGRGNVMPARDLTTSALAKSPTTGFGGAPHGRVSLSFSMGDQVLRFNDAPTQRV